MPPRRGASAMLAGHGFMVNYQYELDDIVKTTKPSPMR
jgi:hypothetical protein